MSVHSEGEGTVDRIVRPVAWAVVILGTVVCAAVYARLVAQGRSLVPPGLIVAGVLLALVLVLYLLPPILVSTTAARLGDADLVKAQNEVRTALVQALGGVAVVGTLYFTAVSLNDTRDGTNRSLELNRQGQLADRFTQALKGLGNAEVDVRVGAIYALEQVATSSADHRLAVVDILTSYLRDHDRWQPSGAVQASAGVTAPASSSLRADFQAALTVLGRRAPHDTDRRLELPGIDLSGADLRGAHFENADLYGAHFARALLNNAHLDQAILYNADFTKAVLDHASLTEAVLVGTDLTGAVLDHAQLRGTNLTEAVLVGTEMSGADIDNADLSGVRDITPDQLGQTKGKPSALPALGAGIGR
jgi:hypothetical protein